MKRRVRLHQLRVGMFVDEFEATVGEVKDCEPGNAGTRPKVRLRKHFLIEKPSDIEAIMRSNVMSAVIDVSRGCDISGAAQPSATTRRRAFEERLLANFSAAEIAHARASIASMAPHVKQMISNARSHSTVDFDAAGEAVSEIMAATENRAGALIGLSRLKEADEGTFLHSVAVSALMVSFGRALGENEETVRLLGIGGLVHDLGKMAIPVQVLNKNGKLTRGEFALIQSHPERGHAMLRQSEGVPTTALDVCLCHHEKFDGSGYPRGLVGEAIPYAARIAAICDVYDALTTVRPYKKAWTQAQAIERMLFARGHFDPALLKSFVTRMVISGQIV